MNKKESALEFLNPLAMMASLRAEYQVRGACLRPLNYLFQPINIIGVCRIFESWGLKHINYFSQLPCKNALLTSSCLKGHPCIIATVRIVLIVVGFTAGLKVFL